VAIFSVEGKLGTGKTKFAVWRAQQALREGRRVASNVDLYLDKLTPERASTYIRLPDKPSAFDLEAIGHGNPESYDEDRNGVLILDELGTWLNSRTFQDKTRGTVIDWLIHARKLGWDVYLIVQDANMIDRQVREALIEYQCRCIRLDKVRIPFLGRVLGVLSPRWAFLPRMHIVTSRVGYGVNAVVADRWTFRGDDLHSGYDTRQVFKADYPHGTHSTPKREVAPMVEPVVVRAFRAVVAWLTFRAPVPALKPKHPRVLYLMRLPESERLEVAARWARVGLLDAAANDSPMRRAA
jgi:hypothetical protein